MSDKSEKDVNLSTISSIRKIPEQSKVPWRIAISVSWASIRRRFFRSLITMVGVVLAIAFLTYMRVANDITQNLVAADENTLNVLLQKAGVDIFGSGGGDRMMILLITLSLLACLVGIMNSMLMSVSERIKEIGTLKCLGALDSFIVKSYLVESSMQGVFGTLLGIVIGLLVAFLISFVNYRGYVLEYLPGGRILVSVLVAMVIGTLLSITASILPAYMAARKQPVDAMRIEE